MHTFRRGMAMSKNRVRNFAIASMLAAAAVVGAAQPASAQEPVSLPADTACSFPLTFTVTGGNLQPRSFQKGRLVEAGSTGTVTVRNDTTGETISFPSRGVGKRSVTDSNSVTTVSTGGQLLLILFPSDIPAGPSTTLYTGRVVFTIDAQGNFELQKTAGRQIDVCAELAA
jgi:hypothetical protein